MGGKFLVRFGTHQGGPNLFMMTGNRIRGFNLPPNLTAFINRPLSIHAIANLDLGPDGHFALTYRLANGSYKQLRSPGLEDWLGIPQLPPTTQVYFTFGLPNGVIAMYDDPWTGIQTWIARDLDRDITDFMAQWGLAFNANIHEFDLGYNGTWAMNTGTTSGYNSPGPIEDHIKSTGNMLNGVSISHINQVKIYSDSIQGFSFSKMSNDYFYVETPLPYLRAPAAWMDTLRQAINDKHINTLTPGYYDEYSQTAVLQGQFPVARIPGYGVPPPVYTPNGKPPATSGHSNVHNNISTGINFASNSMAILANVTGSGTGTGAGTGAGTGVGTPGVGTMVGTMAGTMAGTVMTTGMNTPCCVIL